MSPAPFPLQRSLVVGIVVLLGAALRFQHLDWARGYYFQPDESTHTIDYLLRLPPNLNPYEAGPYTYGGLPIYLYLFTSRILGWIDKWHITLVARGYAAAASALIIPLLYRLSRELGLRRTAWLPPLAFAVTPLAIQYAHYGAVDSLLTFWVVWTSLLGLKAWNKGAKAYWVLAGVSLGLGLATKTTALIWGLIFVAAAGYEWVWTRRVLRGLTILICGGGGMLLGVLLASPYYLFDWPAFHSIMAMQAAKTVTGRILATYHWQFLNVRPFLFEIEQLGRWAVGIPLTVLGGIGLIALWRKEILCLAKDWRWLLVLLPPTLYFGMIGLWHSKFIRYLLPFIPYLCLCAAWPLDKALRLRQPVVKGVLILVTVGALAHTTGLGLAVSSIYAGPDPRIVASEWIQKHIPAGEAILHDPEPLITLPLGAAEQYQIEILDLFGNRLRNLNNVGFFVQALSGKRYVILVSQRQYRAINHLAALFPAAACYYRSLFNGDLGYRVAARFTNYPRLGLWTWNTDEAEETFQVFDHPVVYIFERIVELNPEQIHNILERCVSP